MFVVKSMYLRKYTEGPLIPNVYGTQFEEIETKDFILNIRNGNNCCRLTNGDIVLISNFIERSEGFRLVIGKRFLKVNDFFSKPCNSSKLGIVLVSDLGQLQSWDLKEITMKCVLFPYSDGFVVFPLLHC